MTRLIARALLRLEYAVWRVEAYLADRRGDFRYRARCQAAAHEARFMRIWLS